MTVYDFEYDGIVLSDFGYMIVDFSGNSNSFNTVSNGSNITWNTVPFRYGEYTKLTHYTYDSVLQTKIDIAKNPCGGYSEIDNDEIRWITRWLNREQFLPLRLMNNDFINLNFNAGINVSRVDLGDKCVGFSLSIVTDAPFAFGEDVKIELSSDQPSWRSSITNRSDKDGFFYPKTTIEVKQGGILDIANEREQRITRIKNCVKGEKIVLDKPLISTSEGGHKIQDDFNWNFVRLLNDFKEAKNPFYCSLPAKITFEYTPHVKLSF